MRRHVKAFHHLVNRVDLDLGSSTSCPVAQPFLPKSFLFINLAKSHLFMLNWADRETTNIMVNLSRSANTMQHPEMGFFMIVIELLSFSAIGSLSSAT